jgi:hypothetical protein
MSDDRWVENNQRYLAAALGRLRALLEAHAARAHGEPPGDSTAASAELERAAAAMGAPPALDVCVNAFGLSAFERDLLLLCAGAELKADFADLLAAANGDPRRPFPTFGLGLAALPEAHWSALLPVSPLRRWRLIEPASGESLTMTRLRLDERMLHALTGLQYLDERLQGLVTRVGLPAELAPSQRACATRLSEQLAAQAGRPVVQVCGVDEPTLRAVVAVACTQLGLSLYALRAADVPAAVAEREALARLWEREAALIGSALLLEHDDVDSAEARRPAQALAESLECPLILAGVEPFALQTRTATRLDVPQPDAEERRALWVVALGAQAARLNGVVEQLAAQFQLGAAAISVAATEAAGDPDLLWAACRAQARPRMDSLAQRIEARAGWENLVLPAPAMSTLREIAAQTRRRHLVYERWGFAAQSARGLGIGALFYGVSGTGKTMAAEVLACELELELYRIDLSSVVSKYIGETEKNLRRLFDAAETGGAILLFDEADALFGKRSEVKDSHDRYANIEVGYLLQRMEAYRGLAILTTNMKQALDPAFQRRLRFSVQFPYPDAAQRAEIWRRIFPAATPTHGLDARKLARLNVAGGNIRSIALNAAFLAAESGGPVTMSHLLHAARGECLRLERPLSEAEVAGWENGQ